ncbi:MAG TPA: HAMP domain-containing sensor histidine kinase, partial [Acidimicrobiales bacterium]|nr:HAMP domain-containing sensor histidine kinase [Acidimicrobiales bacterium]
LVYRNSEYSRLDTQLRSSEPAADGYLDRLVYGQPTRTDTPGGPGAPGSAEGGDGHPDQLTPPVNFGERLSATGAVLARFGSSSADGPKLPAGLGTPPPEGRILTVGSQSGTATWRVLEVPVSRPGTTGQVTVLAVPTAEVGNALHRLILIEAAAIGALLVIVSGGAWLVLRSGLRPLERMARTARRISAGDLSQRVSPSGGPSEVGQLGLALNTMLGDIEAAFAEREATEQKLRQFLADASHELRTPLTSIQGFAELFRVSGDSARVDLPTILRRIEEESARMKVLVEDLLLLARLDEHRGIDKRPRDLTVLAADACTDAAATDPGRRVTLDAPEPLVAAVDEGHIRQAVANLVGNALRHTPAGTPLEVGCRRVDGSAVLTVRDHGPGLDAESLRHVFDRFWQGDKARVGTGSGLGLAIVAAIAAEHGGTAEAGNAPDGGAVFTLTLPLGAGRPGCVSGGDACVRTPSPLPT